MSKYVIHFDIRSLLHLLHKKKCVIKKNNNFSKIKIF